MKLLLDTSAYSRCAAGGESAIEILADATTLILPAIAYGELYYGFKHGRRFYHNVRHLDRFIERFSVELMAVDMDVARCYGEIAAGLRKKGRPIPTNDIWISACCMSVGGTLLADDRHFLTVDQITVVFISELSGDNPNPC